MVMIATVVIASLLALLGHYLNRIASARHYQRLEALRAEAKRDLENPDSSLDLGTRRP